MTHSESLRVPARHEIDEQAQVKRRKTLFLIHNFIIVTALISGSHAIHFYQMARDQEKTAAELRARLVEAHLQSLTNQLQPHFLFNSLNAIAEAMHENVEQADAMLVSLSEFLRCTVNTPIVQEHSIGEELEIARRYLAFQQIRFGECLALEMNVESETMQAKVPVLILQPLLENAFRHGLSKINRRGMLSIQVSRTEESLVLLILNDGPEPVDSQPEGTGLSNSRARLESLYSAKARLKFNFEKLYSVRVEIPFVTA
jgi:LytS/YehU family sensor histidine kinase